MGILMVVFNSQVEELGWRGWPCRCGAVAPSDPMTG
jgi:hypothetical protein